MKSTKKITAIAAATASAIAALVMAQPAFAQATAPASGAWPSKPIKVVVPYPAGGYYDVVARVLGPRMTDSLGQPVVVENRVGANAIVGTEFTAKSPADGYTIMVGGIGPHAINASLYPKLSYDPVKDFAPIVLVATQPTLLVVHPSVAAQSLRDLIALAKAKPGQLNFGSNGSGSTPHLSAEMFGSAAGVRLNHIPFKGSAPAVTAVLGGQTELLFGTASDVLVHVRAGKLRAIAVSSLKRLPSLPEVPTMSESGTPGFEATAWFAYYAPAGTPADIVGRLNADINRHLANAEARERLSAQGTADIVGGTAEQLGSFTRAEIAKWAKVVKESGAKAD